MMIRVCVSLLILFSFFAPTATAESPPDSDLATLSLEQLMNVQFYTASKRAQDAGETPASVTVITKADIRTYGYRTLADILQGVRGYWVNSDRNYSYLGVRGLARPGDYNSRILLLVNGHRLNENIYDSALIGTEFPLDIDLIERIEIVRGPSSSLYGTNAFFGVVNVITQKAPIVPAVEASAETATGYARKFRVTVGLPRILDGALFSASLYRSNGNDRLYFPEFDSPETNNGVASGVDGDRYGSAFALLKWKHFQFQGLIGSRQKIIPTGSFETIFNDSGNRTTDSRGFGELTYQRDFASGLQLMSRWYYDGYFYKGTYVYDVDGSRLVNFDTSRGDWIGTEFNVSRPLGHRNIVTAGGELRRNLRQIQQNQWELSPTRALDQRHASSFFAFYAQDELQVTQKFSVNAGLRFDYYSTFGSAVSPRVAAIFRPDRKTIIKYTFGHAFREPNAYEMYYADGITAEANPALKPETFDSHSLSVERTLGSTFRAVVEAFHNDLNHLVDEQLNPASGLYRFVNVNSNKGRGLEFELDAQRRGLRGELSYTVQRSIDEQTRAVLANSPLHIAKMKVQVQLRSALIAGVELQYRGPQLTYLNVRIPDSMTTNLSVSTRKPILGFDVSASCYNLFNRQNYDPISPTLQQNRLLQDGRGFRIKITRRISRS